MKKSREAGEKKQQLEEDKLYEIINCLDKINTKKLFPSYSVSSLTWELSNDQ